MAKIQASKVVEVMVKIRATMPVTEVVQFAFLRLIVV